MIVIRLPRIEFDHFSTLDSFFVAEGMIFLLGPIVSFVGKVVGCFAILLVLLHVKFALICVFSREAQTFRILPHVSL